MKLHRPQLCLLLVVVAVVVAVMVYAAISCVWHFQEWPSLSLIVKHGVPPCGGPSGRVWRNSAGMEFIEIRPGYFEDREVETRKRTPGFFERLFWDWRKWELMPGRLRSYQRWRRVWREIERPFWIGRTEVTIGEFRAFGGSTTLNGVPDRPVANVNRVEAARFARELSAKTPGCYRLPQGIEWEFACRAGTSTENWFGEAGSEMGKYVWYNGNSGGRSHPVKSKPANPWGLYGMDGNVAEWCLEQFDRKALAWPTARHGPYGELNAALVCGGSFRMSAMWQRAGTKNECAVDAAHDDIGFRLIWTPSKRR